MPAITRLGDLSTGHDDCPPVPLVTASGNVLVNGKGAGRLADSYAAHDCPKHPPHTGTVASGSGTVTINGQPAARVGDAVSCGGSIAQGSGDVFVGG